MKLSDRKKLIEVLVLIEANNHISASPIDLATRTMNSNKAIEKLSTILNISANKLEELYEKKYDKIVASV